MQSDKNYKCGNCGTIVEEKFFSLAVQDIRSTCPTCGPLCKECVDNGGLFSSTKCKGCGSKKIKTEHFRRGEWE